MLYVDIKKQFESNGQVSLSLDTSFTAKDGITVLYGPSGSGKTTILRAIAGIVSPDQGLIKLDEQVYFDSVKNVNLPIQKRKVGFVFQDYSLFPHLTAVENLAYGMGAGTQKARKERAQELLSLLSVEYTALRYPRELSGGEQQRIALARALAANPSILLLDEPLSAVDIGTRSRLLERIVTVQKNSGIPFIYVTHNQAEAVHLGNNLLLLYKGRIVQEGKPVDVFNAPETLSAARVVGTDNVFPGSIVEHNKAEGITIVNVNGCRLETSYNPLPAGTRVTVGIRSEDIIVSCERPIRTSARNVLEVSIKKILIGDESAELIAFCGVDFKVSVTSGTIKALDLKQSDNVFLLIKARACHFLS